MRTKQQDVAKNKRYLAKKREQGIIITSFLMPAVLFPEVKAFIKERSAQLLMKG